MDPIVHGLEKKYRGCIQLQRVNYHEWTPWHDLLYPVGSPEFVLLDGSKNILYRWFGVTDPNEFATVMDPLCKT